MEVVRKEQDHCRYLNHWTLNTAWEIEPTKVTKKCVKKELPITLSIRTTPVLSPVSHEPPKGNHMKTAFQILLAFQTKKASAFNELLNIRRFWTREQIRSQ